MASVDYGVSSIYANFQVQQDKLRVNENFHLLSMDFRNYHSLFHGLSSRTKSFLLATNP